MASRDDEINLHLAHWEEQTEAIGAPPAVLRRIRTIRQIAASDHPLRDQISLELIAGLARFFETAMRRAGDDARADSVARWAASIESWLDLPADLRAVAGRPLDTLL